MAVTGEKYKRRRLRSAYISVVISISLVLYLLGIFGVMLYKAQVITKEVKENFAFTILLNNDASPIEVKEFQKKLELSEYVKSTEYIDKDEAAEDFQEVLDEEFVEFLGYNPLMNAIDIRLKADYVDNAKIMELESQMRKQHFVNDIVYDRDLIKEMNQNITKIGYILLGGSLLLALISITLINSSIRLSIYSSRFIIKTMQMVGAAKAFVRKPFINKSIAQGVWGGIVAFMLILATLYYANQEIEELKAWDEPVLLGILFLGLLISGLIITSTCTFFALRKYLKIKPDYLYF